MRIRYTIQNSSLGLVIIGFSYKGICFLKFGDDKNELIEDMKSSFKEANFEEISGNDDLVVKILKFIENPIEFPDFKVDLYGTQFQKKVWKELLKIPPGKTISYKKLAERIGYPKAVRAVANACGANKIAVIIPCHRVLRSNGAIGGYSSGVWRKEILLRKENALTNDKSKNHS